MGTLILTVLGIAVALPVVTSMCYAYDGMSTWKGFKFGLILSASILGALLVIGNIILVMGGAN